MPRREFSAKIKAAAFARSKGFCEVCRTYLYPGKFNYDHGRASALLGDASLANCIVLCINCHGEKTASEDVPRIVKAKRQERAFIGARKPATMAGSRNSKWKKTMSGKTVLR